MRGLTGDVDAFIRNRLGSSCIFTVIVMQNYSGMAYRLARLVCSAQEGEMRIPACCRAQWEALDDRERERYPYEMELWEWLEKLMADLRCFSQAFPFPFPSPPPLRIALFALQS